MFKVLSIAIAAVLFFLTGQKAYAQLNGDMNPVGVFGDFRLDSLGNQTRATVNLNGGSRDMTSPGHIHVGNCSNPGEILIPLNSIRFNGNGKGRSVTTVNAVLSSLNNRSIMFHDEISQAPITCGDILTTIGVGGGPPQITERVVVQRVPVQRVVRCHEAIQRVQPSGVVQRVKIMDRTQVIDPMQGETVQRNQVPMQTRERIPIQTPGGMSY